MQPKTKRRIGGGVVVLFGGFMARESVSWAFGAVMDWLIQDLTWGGFLALPWQQIAGVAGVLGGLGIAFWPEKSVPTARKLLIAADKALAALHRRTNWSDGKEDARRAGMLVDSMFVTFRKAGFAIPPATDDLGAKLSGAEKYFATLEPMLREGHLKEAKAKATELIK